MIPLDDLRQRYARLADEDLLELALQGAETLTPEALELLRSEVRNRGLGQEVQGAIDAQLDDFTPAQHAELVDRFRRLACPLCGDKRGSLNAFTVTVVRSYVFVTYIESSLVIGCPECIRRTAAAANRRTMTLGWWGFPWGIIRTLGALSTNRKALRAQEHLTPSPELLDYVRVHRGEVTALVAGWTPGE